MMNIRLKERQEGVLGQLETKTTFKILESSFIFMKVDVDGLTVRPKKLPEATEDPKPIKVLTVRPKKLPEATEDPKPIKVLIPEGKTVVVCLSTGKAQFLNLEEKVQIVDLDCEEVIKEKEKEIIEKEE